MAKFTMRFTQEKQEVIIGIVTSLSLDNRIFNRNYLLIRERSMYVLFSELGMYCRIELFIIFFCLLLYYYFIIIVQTES